MRITLLPASEYQRVRWKNDLGWTHEIVRVPAEQPDWDWRASIAEIDVGCPFSTFPGCDRELVLLSGNGMRLTFDQGETAELLPPHGRRRFAGELAVAAELHSGPTRDFNLIWQRDRVDAQLLQRPLVGPMTFAPETGVRWLIHVLAGRAAFTHEPQLPELAAGDSALLQPPGGSVYPVVLDGSGEVLLARMQPR